MSVSPFRPVINCMAISHLTLGASSSMPHIHSSMSYAVVRVLITFVIPWGCPGPLALVVFSTTASAMAWKPSCTVIPAQLMGPVRLNPTSLAFPKGSPSLHDHCPKNRIASLWQGLQLWYSALQDLLETYLQLMNHFIHEAVSSPS